MFEMHTKIFCALLLCYLFMITERYVSLHRVNVILPISLLDFYYLFVEPLSHHVRLYCKCCDTASLANYDMLLLDVQQNRMPFLYYYVSSFHLLSKLKCSIIMDAQTFLFPSRMFFVAVKIWKVMLHIFFFHFLKNQFMFSCDTARFWFFYL